LLAQTHRHPTIKSGERHAQTAAEVEALAGALGTIGGTPDLICPRR
jgi:hypothetical protein